MMMIAKILTRTPDCLVACLNLFHIGLDEGLCSPSLPLVPHSYRTRGSEGREESSFIARVCFRLCILTEYVRPLMVVCVAAGQRV